MNITEEYKKILDGRYARIYKFYMENGKIYSNYTTTRDGSETSWSEKSGGTYDVFINMNGTIIDNTDNNRGKIEKVTFDYYEYTFNDSQKAKYANTLASGEYLVGNKNNLVY